MAVGRDHRSYRQARLEFREEAEERGDDCWICTRPIDYELPVGHPDCWSLDHYYSWERYPELRVDPDNFRSSHLDCNRRRGEGRHDASDDLGVLSRRWLRTAARS